MNVTTWVPRWALATLGALSGASALAQPVAPAPVSGAELQAWFDADGMAVAGINVANGCHFIAKGKGTARFQTIYCASMAQPFTVTGEAKVVDGKLCSKFNYPDGSVLDRCQDVIKVGEGKYEFRTGGQTIAIVYRLVP